jgi:hypothetical protein
MSSNFAMSLNSPFSDRLRKNYIAQPEEEAGIETVIEHKRTLIRDLDIELKDIDKAMKALVVRKEAILCRRHAHQTFVDDHQFLLSGILHLPEDVLSKISEDLLPSDGEWPSTHPIIPIIQTRYMRFFTRSVSVGAVPPTAHAIPQAQVYVTIHMKKS